MCLEIMATTAKSNFLRKNPRTGSRARYGFPRRVSGGERDRANTQYRGSGVERFSHRGEERHCAGQEAPFWGEKGGSSRKENYHLYPAGAKAPQNTTQYLMSDLYLDIKEEPIQIKEETPESKFETFLDFLQKDFDESVADRLETCVETESEILRKSTKIESNVRCGRLNLFCGEKESVMSRDRAQSFFQRGQKRPQTEQSASSRGEKGAKRRKENHHYEHPAGSKAPENTTQYLMSESACGDIQPEPVRLFGVSTDTQLEKFLNFLQRDFDEAVEDLTW